MVKDGLLVLLCVTLLGTCSLASGQSAVEMVQEAVHTELSAAASDHTHWLYYEVDSKPTSQVKQWVAETKTGNLNRVVEKNGQQISEEQQRNAMASFINNQPAQAKQHKGEAHDDQQAAQMLGMLPRGFIWTKAGTHDGNTVLNFRPNPQFSPPSWQSRVFAAMAGEITVNDAEHRIVSLKGHLIHDVKFWGGLLGDLQAGGWFDVERRQVGNDWQITETHVHIQGHALIFKTITEQEDDVKSHFQELPADITWWKAERQLMQQKL